MKKHIYKCLTAGIIALLPFVGTIYVFIQLEAFVASSWLPRFKFYFPGLGIIIVTVGVYLVGLVVSTVVGNIVWNRVHGLIKRMPLLGNLYQTFRQMVGYEGEEKAIFKYPVLVKSKENDGEELGFLTNSIIDKNGIQKCVVFIPNAPNPASGKLILIEEKSVRKLDLSVNESLKSIIALGKSEAITNLEREN